MSVHSRAALSFQSHQFFLRDSLQYCEHPFCLKLRPKDLLPIFPALNSP